MQGKTVIVTGANSGIGKYTALELARRGARVVLACRDPSRGEAARQEVRAARASDAPEPLCWDLDLGSLRSVRAFAARAEAELERIDVLINNAGVMPMQQRLTEDGFEAQFGVNHLGHFALTHALQAKLRASAPARVIHVSSMLHARGEIDFDSFRGEKPYKPYPAYFQSKLANVLFSNELARRLAGSGVTSNALHPGGIRTEIMRDANPFVRAFTKLIFKPPAKGAETSVFLAADASVEGVTGRYFVDCREKRAGAAAGDAALAARLWEASLKLAGVSA